jgi:hypothetical protein
MFWRSIKNTLGTHQEPFNPDTSAAIGDLAHRIDAHYDSLLRKCRSQKPAPSRSSARPHNGNWCRTRWPQR